MAFHQVGSIDFTDVADVEVISFGIKGQKLIISPAHLLDAYFTSRDSD